MYKKPESYFSLRELRRSMYMSYGRYDICIVRCDAQLNGAPCCYKKIYQGRVEGHYGETPAIRHIHVKIKLNFFLSSSVVLVKFLTLVLLQQTLK